jgi:hypothetical protein
MKEGILQRVKGSIGFCVSIFVCAVFVFTPLRALAGSSVSSPDVTSRRTPALTTTEQDQKAQDDFDAFQKNWLQEVKQHGQYGLSSVKVKEDPYMKGSYIASYTDISEAKSVEVKKTGNAASPYVGKLKYYKTEYSSRGSSPEEAKKGQFQPGQTELIDEIFRYSKGEWVY